MTKRVSRLLLAVLLWSGSAYADTWIRHDGASGGGSVISGTTKCTGSTPNAVLFMDGTAINCANGPSYNKATGNLTVTGTLTSGSGPTTITNSTGQVVTSALASPTGNGSKVVTGTGTYTNGHGLVVDASGNVIDSGSTPGTVTSSALTTNTIPKATGASALGNSSVTDDGTTVSTTEQIKAGAPTSGILLNPSASNGPLIDVSPSDFTSELTIGANNSGASGTTPIGTPSKAWVNTDLLVGNGTIDFYHSNGVNTVDWRIDSSGNLTSVAAPRNFTASGTLTAGSGPTTLTDSVGKILSAALNTVGVAQGGTGIASGTSGGILGYTASGTLASSGALTVNVLVKGGGAGATPTNSSITDNGTTVTTTEPVLHPSGSAANPSIAFSADTGTGFYRSGSGIIQVIGGSSTIEVAFGPTFGHGITIASGNFVQFGNSGVGGVDLLLSRAAAAVLQMGVNSNTPTTQTIEALNAASGNNNGSNLVLTGGNKAGSGQDGVPVLGKGYTVATLPTGTPVDGSRAWVTDQLTTCAGIGVAPTGGGSVHCPVFFNGSAWVSG